MLKFMHDPAAFRRETDCRKGGLEDTAAVISILDSYGPDTITPGSLEAFPQIRLKGELGGTELDHLLVLEKGQIDLSDVISRKDLFKF